MGALEIDLNEFCLGFKGGVFYYLELLLDLLLVCTWLF